MTTTNSKNSRPGRPRPLWWIGEPHPIYDHMRDPNGER